MLKIIPFNFVKTDNHKRQKIWQLLAGAALTIVVLLAHFFMPSQISALAAEAIRSLHGPGFGVVALLIMKLARFNGRPTTAYVKAGALAMLLAVLAEAAQIPGGREAQVSDLLVDALGVMGFLGIAAVVNPAVRQQIGRPRSILLLLIGVPALIFTLLPTLWLTYAQTMRSQALPQILTFDAVWERTYSAGEESAPKFMPAPAGWPEASGKIARLRSAGQSGLMLHVYPYPDWSGYSAVSFVAATINGETRRIAIGLWGIKPDDGTLPGRYYTRVKIGPEPARYCISLEDLNNSSTARYFDLAHVQEMLIGATKDETGVEILVDDFRLEKLAGNCPLISP